MTRMDTVIQLLEKYRLTDPVPPEDQKRIYLSQKKSLREILRREKKDSPFVIASLALYFRLRSLGMGISLASSARLLAASATAGLAIVIAAGITIALYLPQRAGNAVARGTVSFVVGDVAITPKEGTARQARVDDPVTAGDIIRTGEKSHVTIRVGADAVVKVLAGSSVEVKTFLLPGDTLLSLEKGTVLSKLRKLDKGSRWAVRTHNALAAVRGTEFSVAIDGVKTVVAVREGAVEILNQGVTGGEKTVEAGKAAVAGDSTEIRFILQIEDLTLQKISIIPYGGRTLGPVEIEQEIKRWESEEREIDRKIQELTGEALPSTLDEIRARFGRIDVVVLYNGRVYRGAIASRGAQWKIIVPGGEIFIPASQISRTE